ncbi:MAG TPA: hypothetical protein VFE78_22195 [Gemmataceae bacterium]|jgi:hypothetical protein|nr:hypothetical protein [Gemmataceae bacterium]
MVRISATLLAGLALVLAAPAQAPEAPAPAGNWKVILPFNRSVGSRPLWLLRFEQKDGKWAGKVLGKDAQVQAATIDGVRVTGDTLRFNLKVGPDDYRFEGKVPKEKGAKLYGNITLRGSISPAELEPTAVAALDQVELAKEVLAKQTVGAEAVGSALLLIQQAAALKAKPEEVRNWAARAVKAAAVYGPRFQRDVTVGIARTLAGQKGYEPVALQYARQAERMLDASERPGLQKGVLEALADALTKAGKADEAKEVQARLKKLDFSIKPRPFAGRKAKSDRAVLVELFTSAELPQAVAAGLAFDALGRSFKPGEAVLVQYNVNTRTATDPLSSAAGEDRAGFYRNALRAIPAFFVNGAAGPDGEGDASAAPEKFEELLDAVGPALETPAKVKLKVTAQRKGAKVAVKVNVSDLEAGGDEVRLRVLLVEPQVEYAGANKLTPQRHVVRAFVGKPDGEKVAKGKPLEKAETVDLDALRKELKAYLDKVAEKKPFAGKERPLELKKLAVVAFVQNDETGEVLQAARADVTGE